MTVRTIDDIFRDFNIEGVPSSGAFKPIKPDIRDTLKALTEGDDNFPDNRVIRLNNANAGTGNNIVVTASVEIPVAAFQVLYILNVTQENTGPVTVSGAISRDLVTNTSQPVPAGYLAPGMAVLCIDTGSELRMLSYGDMETIIAAAEAAMAAAEAARDAAEQARDEAQNAASDAVSQGNVPIYSTRNAVEGLEIPAGINAIRTNGFANVGDGGDALYKRVSSEPSHPGKVQSADGAWWEIVGTTVDIRAFGAKADGVTQDQQAIEDAQLYLLTKNGGTLYYPPGDILVGYLKTITGPIIGTQHTAIEARSGISHKGAGKYQTTVKLANNQNCHVFFTDMSSNVTIADLGVDGNRDNQTMQNPSTGNDYCGIILTRTILNAHVRNLFVRNTCDYGIGFEGTVGVKNCCVDNIHFENTGADGFDSKGDGTCHGNRVSNIYGRVFNPSEGNADYQALVNTREGWTVDNVVAIGMTRDCCAVRTQGVNDGYLPYGSVSNVFILGDSGTDYSGTYGIMADSQGVNYSNIFANRVGTLIQCRNRENNFNNVRGEYIAGDAIRLQTTSSGTVADRNTFSNITLRNVSGWCINIAATGSFNKFVNFIARASVNGIRVAAGSANNQFMNGEVSIASGTYLSDAATGTVIRNVWGLNTSVRLVTDAIPTDSAGVKTATVAHGLVQTPSLNDVQLTVGNIVGNGVGILNYYVVGTDATNVVVAVNVGTPAATGSTIRFNIAIDIKRG